jgi:hypothetical protein
MTVNERVARSNALNDFVRDYDAKHGKPVTRTNGPLTKKQMILQALNCTVEEIMLAMIIGADKRKAQNALTVLKDANSKVAPVAAVNVLLSKEQIERSEADAQDRLAWNARRTLRESMVRNALSDQPNTYTPAKGILTREVLG